MPGSIATIEKVRLGGVNQWIVIRGRSTANPVLLMLAGGPGGSKLASFRKHNGALEDHFVVVHWEQRGAGKSFPLLLRDRKRMTRQQYLNDGLELAGYLRRRFGQDKIFLLGHCWGTFLGLWMAQREPGWFWAPVGTSASTRSDSTSTSGLYRVGLTALGCVVVLANGRGRRA